MREGEFATWLSGCSQEQAQSLRALRALVKENTDGLEERKNLGKWLAGYIFYSSGSTMVFAMAPKGKVMTTFHMMPYYGCPQLQQKHKKDLEPYLTGKSCIAFKKFSDLPYGALLNIVSEGSKSFLANS